MGQKRVQNDRFWVVFGPSFWSIHTSVSVYFAQKGGTQKGSKMTDFGSFWDPFLGPPIGSVWHFGSKRGPQNGSKMTHFGSFWDPFWDPYLRVCYNIPYFIWVYSAYLHSIEYYLSRRGPERDPFWTHLRVPTHLGGSIFTSRFTKLLTEI